jgi:hypothetical protein
MIETTTILAAVAASSALSGGLWYLYNNSIKKLANGVTTWNAWYNANKSKANFIDVSQVPYLLYISPVVLGLIFISILTEASGCLLGSPIDSRAFLVLWFAATLGLMYFWITRLYNQINPQGFGIAITAFLSAMTLVLFASGGVIGGILCLVHSALSGLVTYIQLQTAK